MSAKAADAAELAAQEYVHANPQPLAPITAADMRQLAFEDFIAGYKTQLTDLQFCINQLKQIVDMASRESEFYSLSIARHTLQYLGELEPEK